MNTQTKKAKTSRSNATAQPQKKVQTGTPKKAKTPAPPAKKKQPTLNDAQQREADRDEKLKAMWTSAFRGVNVYSKLLPDESDSDDTPTPLALAPNLKFAEAELLPLAKEVALKADLMTGAKVDPEGRHARFVTAYDAFHNALEQAEAMAVRKTAAENLAKTCGFSLNSNFLAGWLLKFGDAGLLQEKEIWLTGLEKQLKRVTDLVAFCNAHSGLPPATSIPNALMSGQDEASVKLLEECQTWFGQGGVTTLTILENLLGTLKPKTDVPKLMEAAARAGTSLPGVLAAFATVISPKTATTNALRVINDSGQNAAFYLGGPGGQSWIELAEIARKQIVPWSGQQIQRNTLHLGALDQASLTEAQLIAASVAPNPNFPLLNPLPAGEDPAHPRFVGRTRFFNDGVDQGMVLPQFTAANQPIHYTEYDVRPFTGGNRGPERLLTGNGRTFYTPDHYQSFEEVV